VNPGLFNYIFFRQIKRVIIQEYLLRLDYYDKFDRT
jgi:hypothetical protein